MLPLEGVRVVEAAQMIAGPLAGAILAEQGADVIKVELPDGVGDRMRFLGSRRGDVGALYHGVNRGKRSIVLDSKTEPGRRALHDLVATADVFVQNFRPGAAERLGLGEAELRAVRPDLVYVSVSGFGPTGPRATEKVYDYVVQAMTGMAALQAPPSGGPELIRHLVVDKVTALTVSQAITAALFHRERGHGGQHVRLSMLDTALWFFWPDGMMDRALLGDGVVDAPRMADLAEIRATSDGHVSLVAMGGRTWPDLCAAFRAEWADDPRFATARDREIHREELSREFGAVVASMTTAECLARMHAHDIPGAAVVPLDRVHEEPQIVHNDSIVVHDNGPVGRIREVLPPAFFGETPRTVPGPTPLTGEHTDEILAELGYDAEQVVALRRDGVLGPVD
jgi:crotonobetainyl-CoA:carnitine CoA-transferase CaiB-like acyl-CoA transferase